VPPLSVSLSKATAPPAEAGTPNLRAPCDEAEKAGGFTRPFQHRISQNLLEKCFTFFFRKISAEHGGAAQKFAVEQGNPWVGGSGRELPVLRRSPAEIR
jgi:hypothetical protein